MFEAKAILSLYYGCLEICQMLKCLLKNNFLVGKKSLRKPSGNSRNWHSPTHLQHNPDGVVRNHQSDTSKPLRTFVKTKYYI